MRKIACCLLLLMLSLAALADDGGLRPLWTRTVAKPYLTSWYLCGPFLAKKTAMQLERDYLNFWGKSGANHPVDGSIELRSDGTLLNWKTFTVKATPDEHVTVKPAKSEKAGNKPKNVLTPEEIEQQKNTVDLTAGLGMHLPDQATVYAFTLLTRAAAGNAYLVLDRNAGISIWLNGTPVYPAQSVPGIAAPTIPVSFRDGDNTLLVKLDCSGEKPGFSMRVAEESEVFLLANRRSPRELNIALESAGNTLTVHTGDALSGKLAVRRSVSIRVSGAGGNTVGTNAVPYGETTAFDTSEWPDGGYDITFRLLPPPDDPANIIAPIITHATWYKGDALSAAKWLVDSVPNMESDDPMDMLHAMLAAVIQDRLGADLSNAGGLPAIYPVLLEWEEAQLQAKVPQHVCSEFFTRLAYSDEVDGSPQFARVYLPPNYQPEKRYPLIIVLHGMHRPNPPYIQWGGVNQRYDTFADRCNAIVLYPFGRANAWYRGLGDRDVVRSIALAKQRFSIDEDRVYLMGYSMGGAGTWHVGSAHPELFAALAPYYGGLEMQVTLPKATLDTLTPREQRFVDRFSSFAQLESLLTTPVYVSQGDQDTMVPVEITRHGVGLLHKWGYPVTYWEQPGGKHGGINTEDKVLPWLLAQRRDAHPRHVRLRAAGLSTASAHWVRVLQREKAEAFVQADAQLIGPNTIRLETENVLAVCLTPGTTLVDMQAPLHLLWNGSEVKPAAIDGEKIIAYQPGYTPMPGEKTAAVDGPIGDIFNTPFIIVIGTASPNAAMRAYCLRFARREIAWWQAFQQVTPRIVLDTRITAEECARYSLLLIGGPEENLVAKKLADRLPLTITPDGFTIDGQAFPVRDGGVRMIYPSPLNAERYVAIAAANSPAGMYRLKPIINRYDVDYAVTDGRPGRELAAGLFDRNWRFTDRLLERGAATGKLPRLPQYLTAMAAEPWLYLGDVSEDSLEGDFDYLTGAFNILIRPATLGGRHYTKSLCMGYYSNAKGAIEYNLAGGKWQHFHAVIGLQHPQNGGKVVFVVKGDGKEIYRSKSFGEKTAAQQIDIPIGDVSTLRLEMEFIEDNTGASACWADARVEK